MEFDGRHSAVARRNRRDVTFCSSSGRWTHSERRRPWNHVVAGSASPRCHDVDYSGSNPGDGKHVGLAGHHRGRVTHLVVMLAAEGTRTLERQVACDAVAHVRDAQVGLVAVLLGLERRSPWLEFEVYVRHRGVSALSVPVHEPQHDGRRRRDSRDDGEGDRPDVSRRHESGRY